MAWRRHERTADPASLDSALTAYRSARDAWQGAAAAAAAYQPDIAFGRTPYARGHWADRLPAIDDDIAALHAIGQASLATQGLDEAAFLPFSASFAVLVPRYVAWLHRREAGGASWSRGEADLRAAPAELGGVELQGRVDRIDAVDGGHV